MKTINKKAEKGFACIFVLMLTAALFIMAALATDVMYSAHRQNQADKTKIITRAEKLNRQAVKTTTPHEPSVQEIQRKKVSE